MNVATRDLLRFLQEADQPDTEIVALGKSELVGLLRSVGALEQRLADQTGDWAYSYDEVARRLGVGKSYVKNLVSSGELRAIHLGHRLVRVTAADLAEYLARCEMVA